MNDNNTNETKKDSVKVPKTEEKQKKDKKDKKDKKSMSNALNAYKSEFKKITWPSRKDLVKQTITVIVISLIVGVIIMGYNAIFNAGFNVITDLMIK